MAWYCQATSQYLTQCWPKSLSPYGAIKPQWVNKISRANSRFAPCQWETALLCNDVSHWLGANLESPLNISFQYRCFFQSMKRQIFVKIKHILVALKSQLQIVCYSNMIVCYSNMTVCHCMASSLLCTAGVGFHFVTAMLPKLLSYESLNSLVGSSVGA